MNKSNIESRAAENGLMLYNELLFLYTFTELPREIDQRIKLLLQTVEGRGDVCTDYSNTPVPHTYAPRCPTCNAYQNFSCPTC